MIAHKNTLFGAFLVKKWQIVDLDRIAIKKSYDEKYEIIINALIGSYRRWVIESRAQ